jgi:hypothetical protein
MISRNINHIFFPIFLHKLTQFFVGFQQNESPAAFIRFSWLAWPSCHPSLAYLGTQPSAGTLQRSLFQVPSVLVLVDDRLQFA